MTPERFREAEAIFEAACALPAPERLSFAVRRCGDDGDLLERVQCLLAHDAQPDGPFRSPVAQVVREYADARVEAAAHEGLPERIGAYRVLELLGEGGFGTVYLAEQQHPRRKVAVKVLRANLASPSLLRRFEYEAQVLGRLVHPGIAQIYEAGTAGAAQAYLAMEYVAGAPLDDYAAANGLDTRARLELFARVCDAVQYAHQRGVIHRDLKPANILVADEEGRERRRSDAAPGGSRGATTSDGIGRPKVLDFGVARVTDPEARALTLATGPGQLVGTLPYMSPEQAACNPDEIDTRSDVYALGVVLYQLLSGRLPQAVQECAVLEAARRIREEPAARLGSVVPSLSADVETIVHQALEKERDRRYQSAADLAADIRRYLAGEPIDAKRDSLVYVLKKGLRRHWLASAAAVAFVLLLTASSVALAVLYKRAETETVKAEQRRQSAERVADFMAQTLGGAGPAVALGRDTTMLREMMDAAAQRIEKGELREAPEAELRLRLTIGDTYRQLAAYGPAETLLRPTVDMARGISGDGQTAAAQAHLYLGQLLQDCGRLKDALPEFQRALEIRKGLRSGDHHDLAGALAGVAGCQWAMGNLKEALTNFEAALAMSRRLYANDHKDVARGLNNVAGCLNKLGRTGEALAHYEAALAMHQQLHAGDHPDVAIGLNNVASCLLTLGRADDALSRFDAALEMRRRLFNGDHPEVARALNNVGGCLRALGRPDEALERLEQSLAMWQRLAPGDHTDVAMAMSNVASAQKAGGRAAEALEKFQAALAMWQRLYPADHPDVARGLNNVAASLQALGRADEALGRFEASLAMNERLFGGDHPHVARLLDNVAGCLHALGRTEQAAARYNAALEMRRRLLPPDHPELAQSSAGLGIVLAELGRFEESEPMLLEAIAALGRYPAAARQRKKAIEALVGLYETRHAAEPEKDYAARAAEWRTRSTNP